jgi:hypothetical protein
MLALRVSQGSSVTTPDGACTVHVLCLSSGVPCEDELAALRLTVGADASNTFEKVKPGDRVSITWRSRTYYVDLQEIRENLADVALGWTPPLDERP